MTAQAYLNHAGETPMRSGVRQRLLEFLDATRTDPESPPFAAVPCRALLARLIGARPDEIALLPNTTAGIGLVATGLDWRPGDNVVLVAEQFPANSMPWIALRARGVEVRLVPLRDRRWTPAAVAGWLDRRTRVVAVSSVAFDTGFRGDVAGLGRICRDHGALFVVDAVQSAGAIPHDVAGESVDVLTAGSYKWLMGPVGCGFAYVRRDVQDRLQPSAPGAWAGAGNFNAEWDTLLLHPDARRFEGGNLSWPSFHAWTAALEELLETGPAAVWDRIHHLTDRLIAGLESLGTTVVSPLEPPARSGIVSFTLGDAEANRNTLLRLYDLGVVVAVRRGHLRVSPHFYNTPADVDRLLESLSR